MAAPASLQSKQWSCASLAAGNNHLLQVKSEESRQRQADLEARKKVGVPSLYIVVVPLRAFPLWASN